MSRVLLGIGSNKQRHQHIKAGVLALYQHFASATTPMRISRVFESAAVGFVGQPFFNLVAEVQTQLSVAEVNQICKEIEQQFGHSAGAPKYSPRTLDIDMLLFDDLISREPVQLPRDEILHNAFVLWPLAELVGFLPHPCTGLTFTQHWQQYSSSQQLQPISFDFEQLPHLYQVTPSTLITNN
ncbi:MAG: 2-amino-4-hydroxy-6-hydroxymethyldihydropteridine diphosphokinase [Pseudidiomarina maritima]|nr:2-amino-4-hydroxy-6-hydroxymethyldihydropteridine diphosphokinase [Pseudidiomarina maritima]